MKGKFAIMDSAADSWYVYAIALGLDVKKMENITKVDVADMVYEKAAGWRDNVKMFTTDTATMEQSSYEWTKKSMGRFMLE